MTIEFDKTYTGKVSCFGGPWDMTLKPDEGLAMYEKVEECPHIFLDYQPECTIGLARRLDPKTRYCAMRFDYSITPKSILRQSTVVIKNPKNNKMTVMVIADWGPGIKDRLIDVSPQVMRDLDLKTDDIVEAILVPPTQVLA
jgi:hypothetical protein